MTKKNNNAGQRQNASDRWNVGAKGKDVRLFIVLRNVKYLETCSLIVKTMVTNKNHDVEVGASVNAMETAKDAPFLAPAGHKTLSASY